MKAKKEKKAETLYIRKKREVSESRKDACAGNSVRRKQGQNLS